MDSFHRSRRVHRLVRRTAATRPTALLLALIQPPLDRVVGRVTGGRASASSWLAGVEITMLTTTGARTGRSRTQPVLGLPDGGAVILIASNYGRPRNPAWYHNLRADPRATVSAGGVSRALVARELSGDERERGFRRGEEVFPGFACYRRWTAGREIPVLRLEPPDASA